MVKVFIGWFYLFYQQRTMIKQWQNSVHLSQ